MQNSQIRVKNYFSSNHIPPKYFPNNMTKEEPIRVTIRGMRRTFYPRMHHLPHDNSPPEKRLQISWVYPSRWY